MSLFLDIREYEWPHKLVSETSTRIALLFSSSINLLPPGCKYQSLFYFDRPNKIAIVNMTTQIDDFKLSGNFISKDEVGVETSLTLSYHIVDSSEKIKKVIINLHDEQKRLIQKLTNRLQDFFKNFDSEDVRKKMVEATKLLNDNVSHFNDSNDLCFHIETVTVGEIKLLNSAIKTTLDETNHTIISENASKKILDAKIGISNLKRTLEIDEVVHQNEVKKMVVKNQNEIDKLNADFEALVEKAKNGIRLDFLNNVAKVLKTEEGRIAVNPELHYTYLLEQVRSDMSSNKISADLVKELLDLLTNNTIAAQGGQLEILIEILKRHNYFNVHASFS